MMNLSRSITLTLLVAVLSSTSCSKDATPPASSSAGALTANAALNLAPRPFAKHQLNTSGFHFLNEFVRPEVRSRMDEEPVGDTDGSFDPGAAETANSGEQPAPEVAGEEPAPETQDPPVVDEDSNPAGIRLDTMKFVWAKQSFGDAVKAAPGSHGVIVLYADENYYDIERLVAYIEEGRDRIAEASGVGNEQLQVVFGGYRSMPQVELWVIRQGESLPEFKPDDRSRQNEPAY